MFKFLENENKSENKESIQKVNNKQENNIFNIDYVVCNNKDIDYNKQNEFYNYIFNDKQIYMKSFNNDKIIEIYDNKELTGDKSYKLQKIKQINEGMYSRVYLFKITEPKPLDGKNYYCAIKIAKEGHTIDETQIKNLTEINNCNVLKIKNVICIDNNKEIKDKYLLMESAETDLFDLKNKLFNEYDIDIYDKNDIIYLRPFFLNIVEEIRKQLVCLLDAGYFYADIKIENILYSCPTNDLKKIKVYLGDLGSILYRNDHYYIITYKPPEFRLNGEKAIQVKNDNDMKRKILSWYVGLLLLDIFTDESIEKTYLNDKITEFYGYKIQNDEKEKEAYQRYINFLKNKIDNFYGIKGLSAYLEIDPNKRPDVRKPISEFISELQTKSKLQTKNKYLKYKYKYIQLKKNLHK